MWLVTEKDKKYLNGPNRYIEINPPAKTLKFQSVSGQPEVAVIN